MKASLWDEASHALDDSTPVRVRHVSLWGDFDHFRSEELLRDVAGEPAQEDVVVDMAAVGHLDWYAVNALVLARGRVERAGGHLRLVNVAARTRCAIEVMASTRLDVTSGPA
jgi:anti-anti-sigma regulatory factor